MSKAIELLKKLEWIKVPNSESQVCFVCHNEKSLGHANTCLFPQALAALADTEAENKALKAEMDKWNMSTKDIERDLTFEEENKRLKEFVEYVASIDSEVVGDPNNENPLSMGELQYDAKQALKPPKCKGGQNET